MRVTAVWTAAVRGAGVVIEILTMTIFGETAAIDALALTGTAMATLIATTGGAVAVIAQTATAMATLIVTTDG